MPKRHKRIILFVIIGIVFLTIAVFIGQKFATWFNAYKYIQELDKNSPVRKAMLQEQIRRDVQ